MKLWRNSKFTLGRRIVHPPSSYTRLQTFSTTHRISNNGDPQQQQLNQLMMKYYLNAIDLQTEEREKRQEQKKQEEEKKQEQSKWWNKWRSILFSSSTVTAVVSYLIYQQSFQPIADMRKTFSGIRNLTTPKGLVVRPKSDMDRLEEEIAKLEAKKFLVLIGPNRSGKSTIVETVLSDDRKYELCHVKLKGASGGDQLMSRLRINFGLEESAIEAAIRKVLSIGDFGQKKQTKQQNELVDISAEVEKRLEINILKMFNRRRVILVDGISHLVYSLDANGDNGAKSDFVAVKELFTWLSQLENCHVVMVSTDGFIERVIREAGLAEHVKYLTLNDMSYDQSKKSFDKLLSLYSKKSSVDFDELYDLCGGRISYLDTIAHDPTPETLDELKTASKYWLRSAARGELGRSTDKVSPLVRYYVLNALLEHSEKYDKLLEMPPEEEVKKFEKYTSIGDGNGQGSCGIGLDMAQLTNAGISRSDIEKLSRARMIVFNPVDSRIALPNRITLNLLKRHPNLWKKECFVKMMVKDAASNQQQPVTISSPDFEQLEKDIRVAFKIPDRQKVEILLDDQVISTPKHMFAIQPDSKLSVRTVQP